MLPKKTAEFDTNKKPATAQASQLGNNASQDSKATLAAKPEKTSAIAQSELAATIALPTEPDPSPPAALKTLETQVKSGDTLSKILSKHGLSDQSIYKTQEALNLVKSNNILYPGQPITLTLDAKNRITQVQIEHNKKESSFVTLSYGNQQLTSDIPISIQAEVKQVPTQTRMVYRAGTIKNSLFESANKAGLSDALIMEMAALFAWEIDFIMDIRQGDEFKLFYEELWSESEKIEDGKIIAAQFINQGETHTGIYFEDKKSGTSGYYEKDGSNLRKAFLRSPVDFARVSSHFNLKRRHPILHKIRAHRGVDYAAARGTPIKSTGQGVVIFKGNKGGYGKTLVIKHGQKYTTLYAHLHKFHRKLRTGSKVQQGQIIGYVGSSGLATGPHLHYEFRVNNIHKNPLTVRFPSAESIDSSLMGFFQQRRAETDAMFESLAPRRFAFLDSEQDPSMPDTEQTQ